MENFKGMSFVSFILCCLYFSYSKNVTDIGKSENINFIPPIDTKVEERLKFLGWLLAFSQL